MSSDSRPRLARIQAKAFLPYYLAMARTVRVDWDADATPDTHCIWLCWHEHLVATLSAFLSLGVSRPLFLVGWENARGDAHSAALRRAGIDVLQVSSRRGHRYTDQIVARLLGGESCLIAPDGPHGPARQPKAGALRVAEATGLDLKPLRLATRRQIILTSRWDNMSVPLPGSRITVTTEASPYPARGSGRTKVGVRGAR